MAQNHKRDIYVDNPEFLVYHWSGKAAAFSPATGETAADANERINLGDHNCRIDNGEPYPFCKTKCLRRCPAFRMIQSILRKIMPSFLDHSPVVIHPGELIAGEFYWQLDEARYFKYPQEKSGFGLQSS